ncbi:GRIP and coiled-coil domain-containing protein 2-like isoform X2 [Cimex lectularius]|uniref:GRIP domain-containing protein n=1 Tax=Cimex lectularius TaxID=79782 RepID=A0A8I6RIU6_CIMLE|nr:GRIP and coiled-coil domain-containing protein 2-like isoform X2 [Cimex lectularius]
MQSPAEKNKTQAPPNAEGSNGELTKEQLLVKCKNLLSIAQKAKTSKDEAQAENNNLRAELDRINGLLSSTTKQYKTAEEMLAALTDQKLKLAMEIDDMKKERMKTAGEVKVLYSVKQKCEAEMENYKQQLQKVSKENNELLLALESQQKSEAQMQEDIRKLHENHEKMVHYCSEGKVEKQCLEKALEETTNRLKKIEEKHSNFFKTYSQKFNTDVDDFDSLMDSLSNFSMSKSSEDLNNMESEKVAKLIAELNSTKADHDKIVRNLEEVRIETRQLIDNSEQLNKEIEKLKLEKDKAEIEFNSVVGNLKSEIETTMQKLKLSQQENNNLKANIQLYEEKLQDHTLMESYEDQKENYRKCNEELTKARQDLETLNKEFSDIVKTNANLQCTNEKVINLIKTINDFTKVSFDTFMEFINNKKLCANTAEQFISQIDTKFPDEAFDRVEGVNANFKAEFIELILAMFNIVLSKEDESQKLVLQLNSLKESLQETSIREQDNAKLLEQCKKLKEESIKLEGEKDRLEGALRVLDDKCNGCENELFSANEKVIKTQEELAILKSECSQNMMLIKEQEGHLEKFKLALEAANNKCKHYENQLEQHKKEMETFDNLKKEYEKELSDFKVKNKKYEEDAQNAQKTQENLLSQLNSLQEKNNCFQNHIVNCESANNELTSKINILKEENKAKNTEINDQKGRLVEFEVECKNYQSQVAELKSVKEMLNSQLNDLENRCTARDKEIEKFKEASEKLQKQVNILQKTIEENENKYKNEKEKLSVQLTEVKAKYEELEKLNSYEKNGMEELKVELNDMKLKCQTYENKYLTFEKEKQELVSLHVSEKNSITSNYSNLKQKCHDLEMTLAQLEQDKACSIAELKELQIKCKSYEEELVLSNNEHSKLSADLKDLSENSKEFSAQIVLKENEIEKLSNQLAEARGICEEFQNTIEMVNQEKLKLVAELESVKNDYEKIKAEVAQYQKENANLNKYTELLKQKDIQLEECTMNSEDIKTKLEKSRIFQEELMSKMMNCKCEVESAYNQLSLVEQQANVMNNELIKKVETETKLMEENQNLIQTLNKKEQHLNDLNSKLQVQADKEMNDVQDHQQDISNLEITISSLTEKCQEYEELNKELNQQVSAMTSHIEQISLEHKATLSIKKNELNKLREEINECKELLNFKTLELDEINKIWAGRLKTIKVGLRGVQKNAKEMANMSYTLQQTFSDRLSSLQSEIKEKVKKVLQNEAANTKHELLDEMQCMNEALKERGEVISHLQEALKEEGMKHEELRKECISLRGQIKEKESLVEGKEHQIKELEGELLKAKEMKEPTADVDVLSTSTISKTEDTIRLRDLEESFEEKYVKLKMVALKLKKRLLETNQQLESERVKFNSEKSELLEKIQHLSTAAKNVQKVQESFDLALDELEVLKKEKTNLTNSLTEVLKNEEALKTQVSTLETSNQHLPIMKKQIDSLNVALKEAKNEAQRIEMEKKVEVMKYEELKKQVQQQESKVQELTASLEQAVRQGKSNNVLELEIKNYEKLCADMTSQLNSEKVKFSNLAEENSSLISTKKSLQEQIQMLENQIKSGEEIIENMKKQLASSKEKNVNINSDMESLQAQVADLKRELNTAKNNSEQTTLEMSNITAEYARKELDMQNKIVSLRAHVQSLETNLASTKQELGTAKLEIEHLREEFDSYRIRAQSTLAKQKGDSVSQGEKEARELIDKLKTELDAIREKLETTLLEVDSQNNRISSLQSEKNKSEKKYDDVTKVLHQKITDYDTLMTEYKAFKLSTDTVLHNLKSQYESKQEMILKENAQLKETVSHLKFELNEKEFLESKTAHDFNIQPYEEAVLQEREDAEGSESVPTSVVRRLSNVVPLDVLLNNPIDDENRVPVLQEQLVKLRNELGTYEVRTRHLSALLSEAEKDAARNSHQNLILKEEVRRLERSLERQPHIANTEYLKNVVFKFLTLQGGDEKWRLIPVLDTILKLSPEEHHKLEAIAKGEGSSSWGQYLQSWTGL